jgi:hypothetical protein
MTIEDQECNECGASDWDFLFDKGYPERRRERDQTVQSVYKCEECGAEGKHFDRQDSGTEQLTGAFR